MTASIQELDAFTDFARVQLVSKETDRPLSLEDCVRLWRERESTRDSIRGLLQSEREDDAGLSQPLDEAFDEVRRQLGIAS